MNCLLKLNRRAFAHFLITIDNNLVTISKSTRNYHTVACGLTYRDWGAMGLSLLHSPHKQRLVGGLLHRTNGQGEPPPTPSQGGGMNHIAGCLR